MLNIIAWAIFGLIAGGLAKLIKPGKQGGGCIVTMILGIVGALVGGFLGRQILGIEVRDGAFNLPSFISAVVGAIIVLFIYEAVTKKR